MSGKRKIILLGHDAFPHGAEILLWHIGKCLINTLKCDIQYILLADGMMLSKYKSIAPTLVLNGLEEIKCKIPTLKKQGFQLVLTNTVVTGLAAGLFRDYGFYVCSLIHELPDLISGANLINNYETICNKSNIVIYPDDYVRIADEKRFGVAKGQTLIYPQGLFSSITYNPTSYSSIRHELGLQEKDRIILGMGFGQHRKGLDLFVDVAGQVGQQDKSVHFLWVGEVQDSFKAQIRTKIDNTKNMHFVPFKDDVVPFYNAADVYFLSSREDPFPCVVVEALAAGLPVVAFDSAGGYVSLLTDTRMGHLVPYLITDAAAQKIYEVLQDSNQHSIEAKDYRRKIIKEKHNFDDYCAILANLLMIKESKRVSVIVTNYNYSRYLPQRLDSIRSQTYPIFEMILLDDKSTDDSIETIKNYKQEKHCYIKLVLNEVNSGSGYVQWLKGVLLAKGEYIWIAEADDRAEPNLIKDAIQLFKTEDLAFVFCDSFQIDENNKIIHNSYIPYMNSLGHTVNNSFVMDGKEFVKDFLSVKNIIMNVSGVLWRRDVLIKVLEATQHEHCTLKVACDWKMYCLAGMLDKKIGFIAKSHNIHRKHSESMVKKVDAREQFNEIVQVQDFIAQLLNLDEMMLKKQKNYQKEVHDYLKLENMYNP